MSNVDVKIDNASWQNLEEANNPVRDHKLRS